MSAPRSSKRSASARQSSVSPPPSKRRVESTTTSKITSLPLSRTFAAERKPLEKAVANFFTPSSQKIPDLMRWRIVNSSLLVGTYDPEGSTQTSHTHTRRRKVAAFDLVGSLPMTQHYVPVLKENMSLTVLQDSTLIQNLSGNIFSQNPSDWRWWHSSVPNVLKQLYAEGYVG